MNDYAILIPIVTLINIEVIMFQLVKFRFPNKKVFRILLVEAIIQFTIGAILIGLFGLSFYARWYLLIIDIPVFITFFYVSKYRDARFLFSILTTIFVMLVISTPAYLMFRAFNNSYLIYNLTRIILLAILAIIIHKFLQKHYLFAQEEISIGWGISSILPLFGSMMMYFSFIRYSYSNDVSEVAYLIVIILFVIINVYILIFYNYRQIHDKYMVEEQKRILTLQNKAQLQQFTLFQEASNASNRRWHDLRHNTLQVINYLENGDIKVAIDYLKTKTEYNPNAQSDYCMHSGVNSILTLWSGKCQNQTIDMEVNTKIPEKLSIDPMDLSALFANAIENAYNACMELEDHVHRFIKVEANYNGQRLAVGVTNTCKEEVVFNGDVPMSSKDGGGIGTKSMIYTIKQKHGVYTFVAKDGIFTTRFVLNV